MKKYLATILIINLWLINFPLPALAQEPPGTLQDAGSLGLDMLQKLPEAIKNVWQNQALPLWRNMWAWAKGFWESTLGAIIQSLWEKLWKLTGQDAPDVEEEFQKEKQEMQKDLWERFKDLF